MVRDGPFAPFWLCLDIWFAPTTTEWRTFENDRNVPLANLANAAPRGCIRLSEDFSEQFAAKSSSCT
jgi:hypothetical protein